MKKYLALLALLFCISGCGNEIEVVEETVETVETLEDLPEYTESAYVELNDNMPEFTPEEKQSLEPFEEYSELDEMGRCGTAFANICPEIQPTEERGPIGSVKPSGWHTVKYNDLIDGNYLYNRCHLIGYQLSGENANEKNLITGTRYLNVVGMLVFEDMVDDYVDQTSHHVLYRVTPIFEEDNLVASGVQIEAWSVEDQGAGICFNVYCYNVQPGIYIDYESGDSKRMEETAVEAEPETENDQEVQTYVLNTNTKKIHKPECGSAADTAPKNKKTVQESIETLKNQGYECCKRCLPGE